MERGYSSPELLFLFYTDHACDFQTRELKYLKLQIQILRLACQLSNSSTTTLPSKEPNSFLPLPFLQTLLAFLFLHFLSVVFGQRHATRFPYQTLLSWKENCIRLYFEYESFVTIAPSILFSEKSSSQHIHQRP